jgi:fatty acid desaturase
MSTERDYSLIGPENQRAVERGLASAEWYESPVPRAQMKELMARSNGRATRDVALWVSLLIGSGVVAHLTWGTWWAIPAFFVYGTLYGSTSDARWHECGHGTAFKTRWPNTVVYNVASFMAMREPVSWKWSHTRHHDDTLIVGRDKEIAVQRPTPLWRLGLELFGLSAVTGESRKLAHNIVGRLDPQDADFIPDSERSKAVRSGRIMAVLLIAPLIASFIVGSIEPMLFMGVLPSMYGRWLLVVYGLTQHAGLAEDVLDHRLNTRTVRMNVVNRFLYSNMNYHIEHHMFPTVPYHQLPKLHEAIKHDLPPVYPGIIAAYREILPAVRRQSTDPTYFVRRPIQEHTTA